MIIGIPKEIKNNENRVSAIPANVFALVKQGNTVYVEKGAGVGSGIADEEYVKAGATILDAAADVWAKADMIIKVKEPLHEEYKYFRKDMILYTYLHLAAEKDLTKALLDNEVTGIAYETVQLANGALPLLAPMSEVAGRMSVQIGAALLQKYNGGRGVLLGGVPGVLAGNVVVAGAGVVGLNAARIAAGMGANVTILDINKQRLQYVDEVFGGRIKTLYSNEYNMYEMLKTADLFVSGVLIPGARAPKIVSEDMVKTMPAGSVIVDVAIDQGGSVATIDRVTTHDNPCFVKHGVLHYSVANMPGAVPRTSTFALSNATLPYALKLAKDGLAALDNDPALKLGLNTFKGKITNKGVEEAYNA